MIIPMLERRQIFVIGKGGVGKTTVAVAIGLAAQRLGKKILLVEVGEADAIGPLFLNQTLPELPTQLMPGIWGARVNPRATIEDYLQHNIKSEFIAQRITRSQLFEHLAAATPGLKEVMTLGQIWRWEQERLDDDRPRYDLVIVDAPATGHGLSLLRVPETLVKMIRIGPVAEQTRVVRDILQDAAQCWLVMVTIPEELPVNEALEFQALAAQDLKMALPVTFINGLYPELFTPADRRQIEGLLSSHPGRLGLGLCLAPSRRAILRRDLQQRYVRHLGGHIQGETIEIPFYFTGALSLAEIGNIATLILNHYKP